MDKDAEMIACTPILARGMISAADEDGLALQATNGQWDSNALIDQRLFYVVMQVFWSTPCMEIHCWQTPVETWKCCILDLLQQAPRKKHG